MSFLKSFWEGWKRLAMRIGGFVSRVIMLVFYYTIMPFFAIPFILFGKSLLKRQSQGSNWLIRQRTQSTLAEFQQEF